MSRHFVEYQILQYACDMCNARVAQLIERETRGREGSPTRIEPLHPIYRQVIEILFQLLFQLCVSCRTYEVYNTTCMNQDLYKS